MTSQPPVAGDKLSLLHCFHHSVFESGNINMTNDKIYRVEMSE